MARPRTISDAEILAAAAAAIGRVGPAHLTLADVAAAAGVSAAMLVQRFGSKRVLLLRLAEGGVVQAREEAARARRSLTSPLAAARAVLRALAALASTPEEMAHHLAFLQMDLTDPDFHRLARAHAQEQERRLRALLTEAMDAGELRRGHPGTLARTLLAVTNGSMLRWAILRKGPATRWLAADIEAVLEPWLPDAQLPS